MEGNKLYLGVGFLTGAVMAGFGTWYFMKTKYDRLMKKEIDDIRESYEVQRKKILEIVKEEEPPKVKIETTQQAKPSLSDYVNEIKKHDYTTYFDKEGMRKQEALTPYIIEPTEYGDDESYETESLSYTLDGVLINEYDEKVDIDDTIGLTSLSHFGEYEDDSVYVRNPNKLKDYEVLLDNRYYTDIVDGRRSPARVEVEG